MTTDGNWNLVVSTPMGERRSTLSMKTEGNTLKGSQMADGNSADIFDGNVNGDEISWKVSITDPMPMTRGFPLGHVPKVRPFGGLAIKNSVGD
jgi:hypothetical protein